MDTSPSIINYFYIKCLMLNVISMCAYNVSNSNIKAVVTYPASESCSLMIKVWALYTHVPILVFSGILMQGSKPSIGIMFVGDKDPSILHENHVHQCYYKSEQFFHVFSFSSGCFSVSDRSLVVITATSI